MPRRLIALVALAVASPAGAQSITDISARLAPQYHSYKIDSPTNIDDQRVRAAAVCARADHVAPELRRRLVVHAGPRGTDRVDQDHEHDLGADRHADPRQSRAGERLRRGDRRASIFRRASRRFHPIERVAAGLIGSDFLSFPITNMGTGFGGTGGVAMALPLSEDWNLGFGVSVRHSSQYDPFDVTGAQVLHYQPGNEYRARVGLDHPVGTGRFYARRDVLDLRRRQPRRLDLQHGQSVFRAARLQQLARTRTRVAHGLESVPHARHARRQHDPRPREHCVGHVGVRHPDGRRGARADHRGTHVVSAWRGSRATWARSVCGWSSTWAAW